MTTTTVNVTGGVDTHKDTHHAAILDQQGRLLATQGFPATAKGYRQLLAWMRSFGNLASFGVEGTGSYGAGLSTFLHSHGVSVVEVNRPNRRTRRMRGKSDPIDAEQAARAVLKVAIAAFLPGAAPSIAGQDRLFLLIHYCTHSGIFR